MTGKHWSPDEEAQLYEWAGLPLEIIRQRHSVMAKRHHWPQRSKTSLRVKLTRLGLNVEIEDGLSMYKLADLLGFRSESRIETMMKYGLPFTEIKGKKVFFLKDVKALAQQQPKLFAGGNREALSWLLENEPLVNEICAYPPPTSGMPQKVRIKGTLQEFDSLKEAARATNQHHSNIYRGLRNNRSYCNYEWEQVS